MSRHVKTDSETSLTASSPPRSPPRRPVYYVQSPSRDSSHDGEKTTNSFHSTPVISPSGSPGRHSRNSSSTRFSGSLRPGSKKGGGGGYGGKRGKGFDSIEEEGLIDEDEERGLPRRCYVLAFVVGFLVLFSFFSLVLWGASRHQRPKIAMKSILVDRFFVQSGMDSSGVATDMLTMNSTTKLVFHNTGTFFGVHVSSTPMSLCYSSLTFATGTINQFYQPRKGSRTISVVIQGSEVPLYGGSVGLSINNGGNLTAPVPLNLNFTIQAKAYVLGKLVKPKFSKYITCSILLEPTKINKDISLLNSCTYK